jgi:hypothetical protein
MVASLRRVVARSLSGRDAPDDAEAGAPHAESVRRTWDLHGLAAYLDAFEHLPAATTQLAERIGTEVDELSEADRKALSTVGTFVQYLYSSGWIIEGFDWPTWVRSQEAQHLWESPNGIERAAPIQLAKMLTTIVRQDRFVDGTIEGAIEDRLIHDIAGRAAALAQETS